MCIKGIRTRWGYLAISWDEGTLIIQWEGKKKGGGVCISREGIGRYVIE